jgi:hypothetical protein
VEDRCSSVGGEVGVRFRVNRPMNASPNWSRASY